MGSANATSVLWRPSFVSFLSAWLRYCCNFVTAIFSPKERISFWLAVTLAFHVADELLATILCLQCKNNYWLQLGSLCVKKSLELGRKDKKVIACTCFALNCSAWHLFLVRKVSNAVPPWVTCLRTHYWEDRKKQNSPEPCRIGTHDLEIMRRVHCRCATFNHCPASCKLNLKTNPFKNDIIKPMNDGSIQ